MENVMLKDIEKVLVSEEKLHEIAKRMGDEISEDYKDKNLLLLGVLKGSVVFMSELMKNIKVHAAIDFMAVSSYGAGTSSSGTVKIIKDIDIPLDDYDVLVVEDILDSGVTLSYLIKLLEGKHAKSVRLATLLNKPERRKVAVKLDYEGLVVPDEFVVGYGLDYDEKYRNLPFIGVLKPEVYSK